MACPAPWGKQTLLTHTHTHTQVDEDQKREREGHYSGRNRTLDMFEICCGGAKFEPFLIFFSQTNDYIWAFSQYTLLRPLLQDVN